MQTRRPRNEYIYATTVGPVDSIAVRVDSRNGDIRFETAMTNVYSEVNYDRPKGPKVLSRIPQMDADISHNPSRALKRNYEMLVAVDTNTRSIRGKKVSVVAPVMAQRVWAAEPAGLRESWQYFTPFCLEYVEIKHKPENFGWLAALAELWRSGKIKRGSKVGMIVDSDLGNIEEFNSRKQPLLEDVYLPDGVTLIYATSDSGKERFLNYILAMADKAASQCLDAIISGSVPFNTDLSTDGWFEGMRILRSAYRQH